MKSDKGNDSHTPLKPNQRGRRNKAGNRRTTCLNKESHIAVKPLPTA